MKPAQNPYAPGAGTPPPELAGRDAIRERVSVALARVRLHRPEKGIALVGLRGVGKTVLLADIQNQAEDAGIKVVSAESPENRSLPAILAPRLRTAILGMPQSELKHRALAAASNFAKVFKLQIDDHNFGLKIDPHPGLADFGDLEHDLSALLEAAGEAAKSGQTALALLIDELQYVSEAELGALCAALHRAAQRRLPVWFAGAGLPQLRGQLGKAKSYAERQFDFPDVDSLPPTAAMDALTKPARAEGVEFNEDALSAIVQKTGGYPYFLQEWGKHIWNAADASPITLADVERASQAAVTALDAGFFRVRFDRLTPAEKRYLRAMAELGDNGIHRSGEVAAVLRKEVNALGPTRQGLIEKGMAYSPAYGDIAFTVPLFGDFLRRIMPGGEWRAA